MTKSELDKLEQRLESHSRDRDLVRGNGYFQRAGDQDFHYLIVQGSRSPRLIELLCNDLYYLLRIYRFRSSGVTGRAKVALDEHKAILAAMRARDPDLCEKLMRAHIAAARENLAVGLGADADPERPANASGRIVDITPPGATRRRGSSQKLR
jgi:DNA-binding GntR family transcriptional regulator